MPYWTGAALMTLVYISGLTTSPISIFFFLTYNRNYSLIWSLFVCSSWSFTRLISFCSLCSSSFSFFSLFSSYYFFYYSYTTSLIASSRFFDYSWSCIFLVSLINASTRSIGCRGATCFLVVLFYFASSSAFSVASWAIRNTSSIGMLCSVSNFTDMSARLAAFGPPFFFLCFFSASASTSTLVLAYDSVNVFDSSFIIWSRRMFSISSGWLF